MQKDKSFNRQVILLAISCVISLIILFYFWGFHDFSKKINLIIMLLALSYIIIELIKKNIFKQVSKWNRIYYIGLFAIISPIALENKASLETIKWINHLGLFFLLIPLMLEASILIKLKKS